MSSHDFFGCDSILFTPFLFIPAAVAVIDEIYFVLNVYFAIRHHMLGVSHHFCSNFITSPLPWAGNTRWEVFGRINNLVAPHRLKRSSYGYTSWRSSERGNRKRIFSEQFVFSHNSICCTQFFRGRIRYQGCICRLFLVVSVFLFSIYTGSDNFLCNLMFWFIFFNRRAMFRFSTLEDLLYLS